VKWYKLFGQKLNRVSSVQFRWYMQVPLRWTVSVVAGWAISCFECHSLDGNLQACEDEFQPYNVTGHLYRRDCIVPTCMRPSAQLWCLTGGAPLTVISQIYRRDCTVGHLGFEAFYCIKIKGVKRMFVSADRSIYQSISQSNQSIKQAIDQSVAYFVNRHLIRAISISLTQRSQCFYSLAYF